MICWKKYQRAINSYTFLFRTAMKQNEMKKTQMNMQNSRQTSNTVSKRENAMTETERTRTTHVSHLLLLSSISFEMFLINNNSSTHTQNSNRILLGCFLETTKCFHPNRNPIHGYYNSISRKLYAHKSQFPINQKQPNKKSIEGKTEKKWIEYCGWIKHA